MLPVRGSHRRCAVWKHQAEHKALNLEWEKLLGSSLVLETSVLVREHSFIDGAGDSKDFLKRRLQPHGKRSQELTNGTRECRGFRTAKESLNR